MRCGLTVQIKVHQYHGLSAKVQRKQIIF